MPRPRGVDLSPTGPAPFAVLFQIGAMPKLTLDLDALRVETIDIATPDPLRLDEIATSNTCWRTCFHCTI